MFQSLRRGWSVGAFAVAMLLSATSAFAQAQGSIRGSVLDAAGKPVPEAEIILSYIGDVDITVTLKTNIRGEFTRAGLRTGEWKMQATKGTLIGMQTIKVIINEMTKVEPLTIKPPAAAGATATDTSGMTAKEVAEKNKAMAAAQAEFDAGVAAIATDPDLAITNLTSVANKVPNCAICYSRIGDANQKKNDLAAAEAAYKKAIELDPKLPDPYSNLAILYNAQKKFDEAGAMSQKAADLMSTSATGGDPAVVFNQGIIFWNQGGKSAEAKAQFEKAIQLDPKMADAHYWLGMANLNMGKIPEAIKPFEEYLKLAPTGQYAETATAILKQIKK
jgi:tetratricopeptide (TPR) repeat protein